MQVFLAATHAGSDEARLGITSGMHIYVGDHKWSKTMSGAKWFESRADALDYLFDHQFAMDRAILNDRLATSGHWQIIELTYETMATDINSDEQDERLRRNALRRLSDEERRVLGLV